MNYVGCDKALDFTVVQVFEKTIERVAGVADQNTHVNVLDLVANGRLVVLNRQQLRKVSHDSSCLKR